MIKQYRATENKKKYIRTINSILTLLAFLFCSHTVAIAQTSGAKTADNKKSSKDYDEETKKRFSKAEPEDINNKNFPDLIQSFDYTNAEISEVVKAISKLTGKNFIIDPGATRGKITIIAPSQITVAEAYKAFLSSLAMNGLTIVPSGRFLKIRQARAAQTDSIATYTDYFPNTDQIITRIIKLKYISAEEVDKKIRVLKSKDGQMSAYGPTNSLILTDYGSNIQRVVNILAQLDVPGFEEQLTVIRIRHAKAREISDLIEKIINKGNNTSSNRSGVSRFRRRNQTSSSNKRGAESYSLVVADERSNSIIVMGNKAGLNRIRGLVKKLDFPIRPEDAGGVHVYYVRHGEAEKIAAVLNGLASQASKTTTTPRRPIRRPLPRNNQSNSSKQSKSANIFGGDVRVNADKDTNSLIITASKQDYTVVKNLLAKIDIQRDQVFVKTIIMDMSATKNTSWGISYFKFDENSNGIGRVGFGGGNLADILNPAASAGAILSFGSSKIIELTNVGGAGAVQVADLMGFVNFLKKNAGGNVLSAPQITALDNEEATIEVGQEIPVGSVQTTAASGSTSNSIQRKKATIKLTLTPFISPDTESVRMNIVQDVVQLSNETVKASNLANSSVVTNERSIKTSIIVNSGDTAVLGGLMQDIKTESVTKVPILGDLPIIGWLFKSVNSDKEKRNLVVFITPQIIRSSQDSNKILDKKLDERINFIQTSMNGRDPHGYAIDNLPRKAQTEDIEDLENRSFNQKTQSEQSELNEEDNNEEDNTEDGLDEKTDSDSAL